VIYFIEFPDGNIKIGTAKNLHTRLRDQGLEEGRFKVLGVHEGGRHLEGILHGRFDHLRIGRKERFKPDDDLLKYIREKTRPWDWFSPPTTPDDDEIFVLFHGRHYTWAKEFCEATGLNLSEIVDRSMILYAKRRGFRPPPYKEAEAIKASKPLPLFDEAE
jgi:hypothetical protein